jgi:hypothetical protein
MIISKKLNRNLLQFSFVLLIFSALSFYFSRTAADPDLYGHLKFGQDIWESWEVPRFDHYSYLTEGIPWINHEWLAELCFFMIYDHWGVTGLILFKLAILILIFSILCQVFHQHQSQFFKTAPILILIAFLMIPGASIRPQMFSYLLFSLLVLLLMQRKTGGYVYLCIPIIFIFWVNLHGGFLAGLAVICLRLGTELISFFLNKINSRLSKDILPVDIRLVFIILSSMLCLLLNPYGYGLLNFLLQSSTFHRPDITEWQALKPGIYSLGMLVFILIILWSRFKTKKTF